MILLGGRLQCEVGPRGLSILWCQIVNLIPTMQFTKESAGSSFKKDDLTEIEETLWKAFRYLVVTCCSAQKGEKTLEFPI